MVAGSARAQSGEGSPRSFWGRQTQHVSQETLWAVRPFQEALGKELRSALRCAESGTPRERFAVRGMTVQEASSSDLLSVVVIVVSTSCISLATHTSP